MAGIAPSNGPRISHNRRGIDIGGFAGRAVEINATVGNVGPYPRGRARLKPDRVDNLGRSNGCIAENRDCLDRVVTGSQGNRCLKGVAGTMGWQPALERGLVFGTSLATWQAEDKEYRELVAHEAAVLLTEDDLLWWRLRPTPDSELDFQYGDRFMALAEDRQRLVFGDHLVPDEGFGEGWTDDDLWGMDEETARRFMLGTVQAVVGRYRGRVAGWVVVNEVIDAHEEDGLRRDYPWYETVGPTYIAEAFEAAHAADPEALLVLTDFGFGTDDAFDAAADRQHNAPIVVDRLLDAGVLVQTFGVQAHLAARDFAGRFDAVRYRRFLADISDRCLKILITELNVLDDSLPADITVRDKAVADTCRRYLEVAPAEPAVASVMTFGSSDRYTWLEEDYPREDGARRRPLPFDDALDPKPAYDALKNSLRETPPRPDLGQALREG